jgi:hypothetical protein
MVLRLALAASFSTALLVTATSAGAAFTCPEPVSSDAPGSTPAVADLFSGASDVTAGNRLGELVADLRRSGTRPALIADRLIGAYCPLVAADGSLSEKQKTDRVRDFARQVTALAYVPGDGTDLEVLVTIPLAPALLGKIDEAAVKAGLTRDTWIERVIQQQLPAQ